nr:immunoglobulin light chain junction region [Macaca mulatta]
CLQGYGAPFTF